MQIDNDKNYSRFQIQEFADVSKCTVRRWILNGIKVKKIIDGEAMEVVIRLKARKVGGQYKILGRWLNDFLDQK